MSAFERRFPLQPLAVCATGLFLAAGVLSAGPLQFKEPAPVEYERVDVPGAREAAPAAVSADWVRVRRADGRGGELEMGRRLVVSVDPGVEVAGLMAGRPVTRVRGFAEGIEIWEAADVDTCAAVAADLAATEGVRAAYPVMRRDFVLHTPYAARPKDSLFFRQWHLENRAPNGRPKGIDVNARAAWPVARGAGVTVAVADNGVDTAHLDLVARMTGQPHFNFSTSTATPLGTAAGDHGTSVAGLIGATAENNRGVAGVAPEASLASYVIFVANGVGGERIVPDDGLADAFRYRPDTVWVQNHSWGSGASFQRPVDALSDSAIGSATTTGRGGLGTVFIRSAGNGREDLINCNDDGYASDPRVIAVGAVRQDGRSANYSSAGASVLVSGPSGDPREDGSEDVAAPNLVTTDRRGSLGYNSASGESGDYVTGTLAFNGTSGSAPVISGVAALILSARPTLGYRDVQQILALSARHTDSLEPDMGTNAAGLRVSHNQGFGVPDAGLAVTFAKHWVKRPSVRQIRVSRSGPIPIPDDSFRLVLGGSLPSNLRNLRVVPSMGLFPEGGTEAVRFDWVGLGNTNIPATVAGHAVLIAGGGNTYSNKIQRAALAGARLAVIYGDSGDTTLEIMGGTAFSPIPAVYLSQFDGEALARTLPGRDNITARIQMTSAAMNFAVETPGQCEHVGVRLRTTHANRGDLRITLVSPKGTRSVLQTLNNDLGPGPSDWTYWSVHHFMEPAQGTWRLEVSDLWQLDTGSILGAELIINATDIKDTDLDGLDDDWERRWFGDLGRGPADDVRGDGLQLVRMQHLDVSPMDGPLLFPPSIAVLDSAQVRATFPTPLGKRYLLEYGNTLEAPPVLYTNAPGRIGWLEIVLPLEGRDERWIRFRPVE